jgi:HAD superfamily hydrolase (TIGR01493 family)
MQVRGLLFDAYGTLFDVHSVVEAGRAVTSDPQALSALWRQKQLEYTWLRSLMGRYEDFSGPEAFGVPAGVRADLEVERLDQIPARLA